MPLLKRMMALDPTISFNKTPVVTKAVEATKEAATVKNGVMTATVAGGAGVAQQVSEAGYNWIAIGGVALIVVLIVTIIYLLWKNNDSSDE